MPDPVEVFPVPLGPIQANCFIVVQGENGLVIDPGDEADVVIQAFTEFGFAPAAVLVTHGHFDHFGGVAPVARHFDVPVYVGAEDAGQMTDGGLGAMAGFDIEPVEKAITMGNLVRRLRRVCLVSAASGALLAVLVPAATAASYWGSWKVLGYYDGVNYESRSAVTYWEDGTGINGRSRLDSTNVQMPWPPSHGYVEGRLFNGAGNVLEFAWPAYNEWPDWSIFSVTDKRYPAYRGTYVSRGFTSQRQAHGTWSDNRWTYPVSIYYDP